MPCLPYKVSLPDCCAADILARRVHLALLLFLGLAPLAGCSSTGETAAPRLSPATFGDEQSAYTITGYGNLLSLLEPPARKTTLADFLYGPEEEEVRWFRTPQGMAISGTNLYVCDQSRPAVVQIDLVTGRRHSQIRRQDRPACPVDVTVGSDRVYVADSSRGLVLEYDEGLRYLSAFTPKGSPSFKPAAVLVADGLLYAADLAERCVHIWDLRTRTWQAQLRPPGDRATMGAPSGLAVTRDGTLLIADALMGVIHRYAKDGQWLAPIGNRGREPGQLVRPIGVWQVAGDIILVADAAKQVINAYDGTGVFLYEIDRPAANGRWTLPCDVVSGPSLPPALSRIQESNSDHSIGWFLVSDTLGEFGVSLFIVTAGGQSAS